MSKRTQKDSGEERVKEKSKPIVNLVSRCSERNLDVLSWKSRNAMLGWPLGELSTVCSQIVVKCMYLALVGWPDILYGLWTNLVVRSQNGQKVCDERLARLITYIHHLCGYHSTVQNSIISSFYFCRRRGRFKINIRWTCFFGGKSHACAHKLDVQRKRPRSHKAQQKPSLYLLMQIYAWTVFPHSLPKSFTLLQLNQRKPKIKHEEITKLMM